MLHERRQAVVAGASVMLAAAALLSGCAGGDDQLRAGTVPASSTGPAASPMSSLVAPAATPVADVVKPAVDAHGLPEHACDMVDPSLTPELIVGGDGDVPAAVEGPPSDAGGGMFISSCTWQRGVRGSSDDQGAMLIFGFQEGGPDLCSGEQDMPAPELGDHACVAVHDPDNPVDGLLYSLHDGEHYIVLDLFSSVEGDWDTDALVRLLQNVRDAWGRV